MNKISYIKSFIVGFFMGTFDLIPGISGGTIAFISGIYMRFIESVKNINFKNCLLLIKDLICFNFKKFYQRSVSLEFDFLAFLTIGILTSLIFMSKIVLYLFNNYNFLFVSVMIGFIFFSISVIISHVKNKSLLNKCFFALGFLLALMLFLLDPKIFEINYVFIFWGGFFASFAMFLPGVSGSYVLVIIGLYEFMLNNLQNLSENLHYVFIFGLGVLLGIMFASRFIDFLFKKDKCKTLLFLAGLVVGSLIIPLNNLHSSFNLYSIENFLYFLICVIIGVVLMPLLGLIKNKILN